MASASYGRRDSSLGVISSLLPDGKEAMGPEVLLWRYPRNDIESGWLLQVDDNQFCVLKSRGAIIYIYETGQYPVAIPVKPLTGNFQRALFEGSTPWQFEALYVNRSKLQAKATGLALSQEMTEMSYDVDYFFHVKSQQDALKLETNMSLRGDRLTAGDVNTLAGPVVEQAVNQITQVTPLETVNSKVHDMTMLLFQHLQQFLASYGITLDTVKVLVYPRDERLRSLLALKTFGIDELEAVRYYTAMLLFSKMDEVPGSGGAQSQQGAKRGQ